MEILIVDGEYKGCEATTFTKGGIHYFRDDLDNSDILLSNHLYIQKDGLLTDVVYLLNLAYSAGSLENFLKNIDNKEIKNPNILRKGRIEKFYSNNVEIENKFLELLKEVKDEQNVYSMLITFTFDLEQ